MTKNDDNDAETLCQKLQFCVCSSNGEEAFHFHSELKQMLKTHLKTLPRPRQAKQKANPAQGNPQPQPEAPQPKKKTQPVKPLARLRAESAFLVLRLRVPPDLQSVAPTSTDAESLESSMSNWSRCVEHRLVQMCSEDPAKQCRDIFSTLDT